MPSSSVAFVSVHGAWLLLAPAEVSSPNDGPGARAYWHRPIPFGHNPDWLGSVLSHQPVLLLGLCHSPTRMNTLDSRLTTLQFRSSCNEERGILQWDRAVKFRENALDRDNACIGPASHGQVRCKGFGSRYGLHGDPGQMRQD
jgi:hypothetical protein